MPKTKPSSTSTGASRSSAAVGTKSSTSSLQKTKDAIDDIQKKLQLVLDRLKKKTVMDSDDNDNNESNNADDSSTEVEMSEIYATVALSVGMMRYMSARLRGLDQGRSKEDPLRKELDNIKRVLAEVKKQHRLQIQNQQPKDQQNPPQQQRTEKPRNSTTITKKRDLDQQDETKKTTKNKKKKKMF
mmetsp:Transcript_27135/g.64895  ORF Transcript_27135/g.64895 Transcript_27135/m.64895 type:complete len:186 (-) Transcript_27135:3369-3926(-)